MKKSWNLEHISCTLKFKRLYYFCYYFIVTFFQSPGQSINQFWKIPFIIYFTFYSIATFLRTQDSNSVEAIHTLTRPARRTKSQRLHRPRRARPSYVTNHCRIFTQVHDGVLPSRQGPRRNRPQNPQDPVANSITNPPAIVPIAKRARITPITVSNATMSVIGGT